MNKHQDLIDLIREYNPPREPMPTGVSPNIVPLQPVRAVLFDIYGTLLVSGCGDVGVAAASSNQQALQRAFREIGVELSREIGAHAMQQFLAVIRQIHDDLRSQGIDSPEVDILEVWQQVCCWLVSQNFLAVLPSYEQLQVLALVYESLVNPVWPMPECCETLAALRQSGHYLGIVSNAQFFTPLLFEGLCGMTLVDLGFHPELIDLSYQAGFSKPSCQSFTRILGALASMSGIVPAEVVYVGNDMLNDVATAARAGCQTVLFAGDQRSLRWRSGDKRVDGIVPDVIVTSLDQLLNCF